MSSNNFPDYSYLGLQILGKLGDGTYGNVFRTIYKGQEYALKVYKDDCFYPPTELDISMRIRTPYIMTGSMFFDPSLTQYTKSLLLLPLANTSLSKILSSRSDVKLTLDEKKIFFYKLACGLHALHSNGILHLDIKPDNILVINDGKDKNGITVYRPCLADFGLSKYVTSVKTGFTVEIKDNATPPFGTPNYMPPEHFNLVGRYGGFTDIWSLGVVGLRLFFNMRIADSNDISTNQRKIKELTSQDKYNSLISKIEKSIIGPPKVKKTKSAKSAKSATIDNLTPEQEEKFAILNFLKLLLNPNIEERYNINQVLSSDFFRNINIPQPFSYTIFGNFISITPTQEIRDPIRAVVDFHDNKSTSSRPTRALDFFQAIDVIFTTFPLVNQTFLENVKQRRAFGIACVLLCHQGNCITAGRVLDTFKSVKPKNKYTGITIKHISDWINIILNQRSSIIRNRNLFHSAISVEQLQNYRTEIINNPMNYLTYEFCTNDPIINEASIDNGALLYKDIM